VTYSAAPGLKFPRRAIVIKPVSDFRFPLFPPERKRFASGCFWLRLTH
jgi:hypothetical protein